MLQYEKQPFTGVLEASRLHGNQQNQIINTKIEYNIQKNIYQTIVFSRIMLILGGLFTLLARTVPCFSYGLLIKFSHDFFFKYLPGKIRE